MAWFRYMINNLGDITSCVQFAKQATSTFMKVIIGAVFLFIGAGFFLFFVKKIPSLVSSLKIAIETDINANWGSFMAELTIVLIAGVIGYFLIRFGIKAFRLN